MATCDTTTSVINNNNPSGRNGKNASSTTGESVATANDDSAANKPPPNAPAKNRRTRKRKRNHAQQQQHATNAITHNGNAVQPQQVKNHKRQANGGRPSNCKLPSRATKKLQQSLHHHNGNSHHHNGHSKADSENIPLGSSVTSASALPGPSQLAKNASHIGGRHSKNGPGGVNGGPKGMYKSLNGGGVCNGLTDNGGHVGVGGNGDRGPPLAVPKFFIASEKRLRKDIIVPPTKFLLGGNISDPLNLNSLQDEALNSGDDDALAAAMPSKRMAAADKTPPKVDVLVRPNVFDPLHLLDVPDAKKYEQMLISPLKRKAKLRKIRMKKAPKVPMAFDEDSACMATSDDDVTTTGDDATSVTSSRKRLRIGDLMAASSCEARERCSRVLQLDLDAHLATPRKRKISETSNATSGLNGKPKMRRRDSMDKIVSPVIPQPGAWKRPPLLPTGAPRSRVRAQSITLPTPDPDETGKAKLTTNGFGEVCSPVSETAPQSLLALVANASANGDQLVDGEPQANAVVGLQTLPVVRVPKLPATDPFQYGNFVRQVGHNRLDGFSDTRFRVLIRYPFLFRDKDVLDIGCNVGYLTIAVGQQLAPKSIVGMDIDAKLIARARRSLTMFVPLSSESPAAVPTRRKRRRQHHNQHQQQQQHPSNARRQFYPISFPICYGQMPNVSIASAPAQSSADGAAGSDTSTVDNAASASGNSQQQPDTVTDTTGTKTTVPTQKSTFPHNTYFKTFNYTDGCLDASGSDSGGGSGSTADTPQYDLILCMSVTKWLHLNYGDAGLKAAFRRMFNQLRPGGKLILEAHNWASYKKSKRLTQTIYDNYQCIEFFPNKFHEYLLSPEVGFSHSMSLGIARHHVKGFRRPIQLYVKGDFTPSQQCWSDNYHASYTPYNNANSEYYADIRQPPRFYGNGWQQTTPHAASGRNSRGAPSAYDGPAFNEPQRTPYYNWPGGGLAPGGGSGPGPLSGLPYTSQYYNPLETDNYLPSYDNEQQTRRYCFQSPLYSTVWSPPSGPSGWSGGNGGNSSHRSASNTPLFGSIRQVTDGEADGGGRRHVYFNGMNAGRDSTRSVDESSRSPQMQHYLYGGCGGGSGSSGGGGASGGSGRDAIGASGASPRDHVYAGVVVDTEDNSQSPSHVAFLNGGENSHSGADDD